MADSENNRVVEYHRSNGSWNEAWSWRDDRLTWPRDADRLPNGHTLITDSNGGRVLEIDQGGSVVWSVPVDTPYEAERLGTGDESAGGSTVATAGGGNTVDAALAPTEAKGNGQSIVGTIRGLLPSLVVNGILFVLPPWIGVVELLFVLLIALTIGVWCAVEAYWSNFTIRSPVVK